MLGYYTLYNRNFVHIQLEHLSLIVSLDISMFHKLSLKKNLTVLLF